MSTTKLVLLLGGILLAGFVICAGGIGLVAYSFYSWRAPSVAAANEFLDLCGQERFDEAYEAMAATSRQQQSKDAFIAAVKDLQLTEYRTARWPSWKVDGNLATLSGQVTTLGGDWIDLTMQVLQENGAWRVASVNRTQAKAQAASAALNVPDEDEAAQLALATLLDFNAAVRNEDFKPFHENVSKTWQAQITAKKLREVFQAFIDMKVDVSDVKNHVPEFTAPVSLRQDKVLVLKGSYPTKPMRVVFELLYVHEKSEWKLLGINVQTKPNAEAGLEVPQNDEAVKLVRTTLKDFNKALQAKDFAGFHAKVSKAWQAQITAEKLKAAFQGFIDNEVNLDELADMHFEFTEKPRLDENNLLVLKGHYPVEGAKISFELRFVHEASEWKLFGINVQITGDDAA